MIALTIKIEESVLRYRILYSMKTDVAIGHVSKIAEVSSATHALEQRTKALEGLGPQIL